MSRARQIRPSIDRLIAERDELRATMDRLVSSIQHKDSCYDSLSAHREYLLVALENLLEFLEPDSLIDQQTDARLRLERDAAIEAARRAVAIAKGEK